jgi:hypothetical protein
MSKSEKKIIHKKRDKLGKYNKSVRKKINSQINCLTEEELELLLTNKKIVTNAKIQIQV